MPNNIEALKEAHRDLDGLLNVVEPALIGNELKMFCDALGKIKTVEEDLQRFYTEM